MLIHQNWSCWPKECSDFGSIAHRPFVDVPKKLTSKPNSKRFPGLENNVFVLSPGSADGTSIGGEVVILVFLWRSGRVAALLLSLLLPQRSWRITTVSLLNNEITLRVLVCGRAFTVTPSGTEIRQLPFAMFCFVGLVSSCIRHHPSSVCCRQARNRHVISSPWHAPEMHLLLSHFSTGTHEHTIADTQFTDRFIFVGLNFLCSQNACLLDIFESPD